MHVPGGGSVLSGGHFGTVLGHVCGSRPLKDEGLRPPTFLATSVLGLRTMLLYVHVEKFEDM